MSHLCNTCDAEVIAAALPWALLVTKSCELFSKESFGSVEVEKLLGWYACFFGCVVCAWWVRVGTLYANHVRCVRLDRANA